VSPPDRQHADDRGLPEGAARGERPPCSAFGVVKRLGVPPRADARVGPGDGAFEMLSFDEARHRLLSGVARLSAERVPLVEAVGRVLAQDLIARDPLPPFDHSAMDGYALAAASLEGAPPWRLAVVGESTAGASPPAMAPGTACRIFTGARLPAESDAVVMQEDVHREGSVVRIDARPARGQHVRRRGEDLASGVIALASGTRVSPGGLALAGMMDRAEILVTRRPRVTILCTGNELRSPGDGAREASIPESNSAPLAALARQAGALVRIAAIAPDDLDEVSGAIAAALEGTDVLLTVGGVSVGDLDVVRPALERAGVVLDFWKVAIKPGKPLAVGATSGARVLGLPGNPASAMVTFAMFGAPLLRALQGDARPHALRLPVRLAKSRKRSPERLEMVRAALEAEGGALQARVHDNQSSGAATSLASSDGLALVPAGAGVVEAGALVDFVRWSDV
jgi:molybdopterin molybdotransferase